MVYTIAYRYMKQHEEAEEVAQDSFVKCHRNLHKFRRESKFSSWLYRITINTALTKTRKSKMKAMPIDELDWHNDIPRTANEGMEQLNASDRQVYIDAAMERIPADDASALTLYYTGEHTVDEIAEILGMSNSNVKIKLHRGRKRLYNELCKVLQNETHSLL